MLTIALNINILAIKYIPKIYIDLSAPNLALVTNRKDKYALKYKPQFFKFCLK